ncbi:hypothetical protein Tco_0038621 [Tanacetum coccineum]
MEGEGAAEKCQRSIFLGSLVGRKSRGAGKGCICLHYGANASILVDSLQPQRSGVDRSLEVTQNPCLRKNLDEARSDIGLLKGCNFDFEKDRAKRRQRSLLDSSEDIRTNAFNVVIKSLAVVLRRSSSPSKALTLWTGIHQSLVIPDLQTFPKDN